MNHLTKTIMALSVFAGTANAASSDVEIERSISPVDPDIVTHQLVNGKSKGINLPSESRLDSQPREVIFKLKSQDAIVSNVSSRPGVAALTRVTTTVDEAQGIAQKFGLSLLKAVGARRTASVLMSGLSAKAAGSSSGAATSRFDIYKAAPGKGQDVHQLVEDLNNDSSVEWAEVNGTFDLFATTPNDPDLRSVPFSKTKVSEIWDYQQGSEDVVIAVIDTGVDYTHPDLVNNIWININEVPGDGIDNDGNGFVDDVKGWDFVSVDSSYVHEEEDYGPADNDPMDVQGHGTHVSGISAAEGNNNLGIAGVSWHSKIMPVRAGYKIPSGQGSLQWVDVADALVYACDNGADIVNMSFGSTAPSRTVEESIEYCAERDVLLVAAAGNSGTDHTNFPAAYDQVLSVAASNLDHESLAHFSNFGIWVDIALPGNYIYSTVIGGGYDYMSGTSMASPFAAGMAALIKSQSPSLRAQEISTLLRNMAQLSTGDGASKIGGGYAKLKWPLDLSVLEDKTAIVALSIQEDNSRSDLSFDAGEHIIIRPTVRNFGVENETITLQIFSDDPYLSITDSEIEIEKIQANRKKTNWDDVFGIDVLDGVPNNYKANFSIKVNNGGGEFTEESHTVELNKLFKTLNDGSPVSQTVGYTGSRLVEHNDGRISHLYRSQNGGVPNFYHRIRNASGVWSSAVPIPVVENHAVSNFSAKTDEFGRLHVAVKLLNNVQYALYDGEWQTEIVSVTTPSYSPEPQIILDAEAKPLVVWAENDEDSSRLMLTYKNNAGWSPVEVLAEQSGFKKDNLNIVYDDEGVHILWKGSPIGEFDGELMQAKWLKGEEFSPVSLGKTKWLYGMVADTNNNLHIAYRIENTKPAYGLEKVNLVHQVYDGFSWGEKSSIYGNSGVLVANNLGGVDWLSKKFSPIVRSVYTEGTWSEPKDIHTPVKLEFFSPTTFSSAMMMKSGELLLSLSEQHSPYAYSINIYSSFVTETMTAEVLLPVDEGEETSEKEITAFLDPSATSSVKSFQYAIGSAPGQRDLLSWTEGSLGDNVLSLPSSLPRNDFVTGQDYYVSTRSVSASGYRSATTSSDGITYVDPVGMISPVDGQAFANATETFRWEPVEGNSGYTIKFGTTEGGSELGLHSLDETETTFTKTDLPMDGSTVYVSLIWTTNFDGVVAESYEYIAATQAGIISPVNGVTLTSDTQTFEWEAVPNSGGYIVRFGSTLGGSEYGLNFVDTAETSITKSGLPVDGSTVYVALAWSEPNTTTISVREYSYTAYFPVELSAEIISPVDDATFNSSSQIFVWNEIEGADAYFLAIGSTGEGSRDLGEVVIADWNTSAHTFSELPTDGRAIYVMLRVLVGDQILTSHYTYTAYTAVQAPSLSVSFKTSWTGATTTVSWSDTESADVYRNGTLYSEDTTENPLKVKTWWSNTRYDWKVCQPNTDVCSDTKQ